MVTVLMATYQGKKYLEQQLDSILAQTVPVRILCRTTARMTGPGRCSLSIRAGIRSRCF